MSKGKAYFNKGEMVDVIDRVFEDVLLPEWGGKYVCVRSLTAAEKDAFEKGLSTIRQVGRKMITVPNLVNVRARMVALCVVDPETHERIFNDSDDVIMLGNKSASAIDRIIAVCKRLSRWDDDELEKMTAELKNDQPAASPTD